MNERLEQETKLIDGVLYVAISELGWVPAAPIKSIQQRPVSDAPRSWDGILSFYETLTGEIRPAPEGMLVNPRWQLVGQLEIHWKETLVPGVASPKPGDVMVLPI